MFDPLPGVLGTDSRTILWWQMLIRGVVVFGYLIVLIRVGAKRMFGRLGAVDIAVAILLGATLSRTITANARFIPGLAVSGLLVALHFILVHLSFRWSRFGRLVKGTSEQLVHAGKLRPDSLRRANVSREDLLEEMRLRASTTELDQVGDAYLERSGEISFIPPKQADAPP